MRRILFIWLFVLIRISPGFGKPVTQQEIRTVVKAFVESVFPSGNHYEIGKITPVLSGTDIPVYIVNLEPEGWVLMAGDDKATPVLGYSATGYFDSSFPVQGNIGYWMGFYSKAMVSVMKDRSLTRNVLWNGNSNAFMLKSASVNAVEPMISVKWDQGKTWNRFCPADENGPDGHAYVGCVGVSMAQAMSLYHYPRQGTGSKTYYHKTYGTLIIHYDRESPYQWDSMALELPDKYNARLLYHCAVSVAMNFGAEGSSALTRSIPAALSKYFKYYSGARYVTRYDNDTAWTDLLVSELLAGRPLIYSGFPEDNTPGHAFNIDGVDSRGYFHLNWGWNGRYNAYFLINNLRPGTNSFIRDQGAVINIRPPVFCPTDLDLTKKNVKEGMPAGTYVGMLKITDEAKDNVYIVRLKGDSVGENTYLPPDFHVSNDSLKTNKEFLYNERSEYTLYIEVEDTIGHVYQEKFNISILKNTPVTGITGNADPGIEVFPNPSTGQLIIKTPFPGRFSADLTDQWGRRIFHQESDGLRQILQIDHIFPGIYFIQITPENGIPVTRKVIIH